MVIVLKTNKGFTLLEMIIVLFILSSFMLLILSNSHSLDLSSYYFMNDYLVNQAEAINSSRRKYLDYGISFNIEGHVNMARTINVGKHSIIIHLGTGYITYE